MWDVGVPYCAPLRALFSQHRLLRGRLSFGFIFVDVLNSSRNAVISIHILPTARARNRREERAGRKTHFAHFVGGALPRGRDDDAPTLNAPFTSRLVVPLVTPPADWANEKIPFSAPRTHCDLHGRPGDGADRSLSGTRRAAWRFLRHALLLPLQVNGCQHTDACTHSN